MRQPVLPAGWALQIKRADLVELKLKKHPELLELKQPELLQLGYADKRLMASSPLGLARLQFAVSMEWHITKIFSENLDTSVEF
jgi:hypothetical protein